jgi:hypothetical protein
MWIEIKDDIFESNDLKNLQFLLNIIFETKGSIFSKAKLFLNFNSIKESDLFNKLDSIDQELIQDSVKSSFYENQIEIKYFISNDEQEDSYKLEEALELLREPLWIVLENSFNDSNFIKSIIYNFDDSDKFVTTCIENRWIDFANAGGSGAKNQIRGKLETFNSVVIKHNTQTHKYYRGLVILDSEKNYKDEPKSYNSLIDFFKLRNIKWHILEKRSIENYMPDEVIFQMKVDKANSHRTDDKDCIIWINAYQYLSDLQKDFLRYEKQPNKSSFQNSDLAEINKLFNISVANYSIFEKGINYRDNESFGIQEEERRYKNSFPKKFIYSPLVNKQTLKKRCGNDELERIYLIIKSML